MDLWIILLMTFRRVPCLELLFIDYKESIKGMFLENIKFITIMKIAAENSVQSYILYLIAFKDATFPDFILFRKYIKMYFFMCILKELYKLSGAYTVPGALNVPCVYTASELLQLIYSTSTTEYRILLNFSEYRTILCKGRSC